jgi:hypothetical protein
MRQVAEMVDSLNRIHLHTLRALCGLLYDGPKVFVKEGRAAQPRQPAGEFSVERAGKRDPCAPADRPVGSGWGTRR